jgi:hypothetical protein
LATADDSSPVLWPFGPIWARKLIYNQVVLNQIALKIIIFWSTDFAVSAPCQLKTTRGVDLHSRGRMTKRGPQCTICAHREHAAIDLALVRGVAVRALARRYKVGSDSIYRHAKAHLPPQLRAALLAGPDTDIDLDKLRDTESQSLLANLISIRRRLFASLDVAEEFGDGTMISRVAGQLHHNLEITGKLLGDLSVGGTTITNVLVMPAYVEMRVELVRALQPYPEARQAVAAVLHTIEHRAADDMRADTRELAS